MTEQRRCGPFRHCWVYGRIFADRDGIAGQIKTCAYCGKSKVRIA